MMIPIMEAVLQELENITKEKQTDSYGAVESQPNKAGGIGNVSAKNFRAMLAMSVCMSANVGGTGTTIGKLTLCQVTNSNTACDQFQVLGLTLY